MSAVVSSPRLPIDSHIHLFQANTMNMDQNTSSFSDDYNNELRARQVIEALQLRVANLERINVDLEYRLEDQAKQCMNAEKECIETERMWRIKCASLEEDVKSSRSECEVLKTKGDRLRDHLSRTEREMYSILQRKYEIMRGPAGPAKGKSSGAGRGGQGGYSSQIPYMTSSIYDRGVGVSTSLDKVQKTSSLEEFLAMPPSKSSDENRKKKVLEALNEFLWPFHN